MLVLKSKKVVLEATGQPFSSLALDEVQPYTGFYHEVAGNFMVGPGQIFAWLYTNPEALAKLSREEYDLVFFPPGRSAAMAFRGSLLDEAWQPRKRRGHRELMALVDGVLCEVEGTPTLLIRRMSVRKCYRRNGLNTQLIKVLHSYHPSRELAFEDLTQEGYEFVQRAFPDARHVWSAKCTARPLGYQPQTLVHSVG